MNRLNICLLFLFCHLGFAAITKHTLSLEELQKNPSSYVEVNPETIPKISPKTDKKTVYPVYGEIFLHLEQTGIKGKFDLQMEGGNTPVLVLPKGWIPISLQHPDQFSRNQNLEFVCPDSEKICKTEIHAFFPLKIENTKLSVNIPLPILESGIGSFSFAQNSFQNPAITLRNPEKIFQFSHNLFSKFPLGRISSLDLEAFIQVALQEKPKNEGPEVTRELKTKIFTVSEHQIEVFSKKISIKTKVDLNIPGAPVSKISLNLPVNMNLLEVKPENVGFTWNSKTLTLEFHRPVSGFLPIWLESEISFDSSTNTQGIELRLPSFKNTLEDRGWIALFTKDILKINQIRFDNLESVNLLDISELPNHMKDRIQAPILYAFRYYQPDFTLLIDTEVFEPVETLENMIERFEGQTSVYPDFTTRHQWTFFVQNTRETRYELPLPKNASVKSCQIDNQESRIYRSADQKITVPLKISSQGFSQIHQKLFLFANKAPITSLNPIKIQVEFTTEKQENELFVEVPLPPHAQDLHYRLHLPAKMRLKNLTTNLDFFPEDLSRVPSFFDAEFSRFLALTLLGFGLFLAFLTRTGMFFEILFNENGKRNFSIVLFLLFSTLILIILTISLDSSFKTPNSLHPSALHGTFFPANPQKIYQQASNPLEFSLPQSTLSPVYLKATLEESSENMEKWLPWIILSILSLITFFAYHHSISVFLITLFSIPIVFHLLPPVYHPPSFFLLPFCFLGLQFLLSAKKLRRFIPLFLLLNGNTNHALDLYELKQNALPNSKTVFMKTEDYKQIFTPAPPQKNQICPLFMSDFTLISKDNNIFLNAVIETAQNCELNFPNLEESFLFQGIYDDGESLAYKILNNKISVFLPHNQDRKKIELVWLSSGFPQKIHLPEFSCAISRFSWDLKGLTAMNLPVHTYKDSERSFFFDSQIALELDLNSKKSQNTQIATESFRTETLDGTAKHIFNVEENFLEGKSEILLKRTGSPLNGLKIQLPKRLHIRDLTSSVPVSDWFIDENQSILVLKFLTPWQGNLNLDLSHEISLKTRQAVLDSFFVYQTDKLENHWKFNMNENLDCQVLPSVQMKAFLSSSSQDQRTPEFIQETRKEIPVLEQNFEIRISPRQIIPTQSAYIDRMWIRTWIQKDGLRLTRYEILARNNGQQFLRFTPDKNEKILTSRINGERLKTGKQGEDFLFPMKMVSSENGNIEPFLIECTTLSTFENPLKNSFTIPKTSLPVAKIQLDLGTHPQYELSVQTKELLQRRSNNTDGFLKNEEMTKIQNAEQAIDLRIFIPDELQTYSFWFYPKDLNPPPRIFFSLKQKKSQEFLFLMVWIAGAILSFLILFPKKILKTGTMGILFISFAILPLLSPVLSAPLFQGFCEFLPWVAILGVRKFFDHLALKNRRES